MCQATIWITYRKKSEHLFAEPKNGLNFLCFLCSLIPSPHRVSKLHATLPEFGDAVYKNKFFRLKELF